MKYDVFISYKRKSLATANNLYYRLTTRGYSTFFDLEEMRRDNFNVQLLNYIENAKDVFILLEEGSLDACKQCNWEEDWFCKEIAHALKTKRNIIPILIGDYKMPKQEFFPKELQELSLKSAPEFSFSYFEEYLTKLIERGYITAEARINNPSTSIFKFYSNEKCQIFKEGKLVCSLEGMSDEPYYLPVPRKGDYRFKCINSITEELQILKERIDAHEERDVDIHWDEHKSFAPIQERTETKKISRDFFIVELGNIKFKMIKVDGGRFDMGAENSAYDESPVHNVTLSDYYMAETPVTQELWNTVMGNNPSYFKNKDFPVEEVSWVDCIEFIKKLNSITGKELRLPTEAEWEYAARGGKYAKGCIYSGSNDINQVAWWAGNSENTTHMVKTKLPNELGIYDMSGNVWEWCNDNSAPYSNESVTNPQGPSKESSKVQRGGCWDGHLFANKDSCKVTYRSSDSKIYSSKRIGLRLAMSASNMPVPQETKILPNIFKLTIADKDIHMLLSANKEYYIGNILDKNAKFNWLKENSKISAKDAMIAGATITGLTVTPILTLCAALLYWLFKPDKDKKNDEVIIDENFCNAISGDYKFSIPNADELKDVIESEKSHCFVLRLSENPQLNEVLSK